MMSGRIIRATAALAVLLTLGACAPATEEQFGQCEPGVEGLSQTMSGIPTTPCATL